MAWLSQLSAGTPYLTGIALPMIVLGIGAGAAFTPLTSAGVAGVRGEDAGAASGLVNVAHQVGGSLGLGILVTVFVSATPALPQRSLASATAQSDALAHAISASLTGGTVMLAIALAVVLAVVRRPAPAVAVQRVPEAPAPIVVRRPSVDHDELEEALAEEIALT
jgi:hypothetical protein